MSQPSPPDVPPLDDANPLNAFERIHRQMAEAHMATTRALAESHAAYLRASEMALRLAAGHVPAADAAADAAEDAASRHEPAFAEPSHPGEPADGLPREPNFEAAAAPPAGHDEAEAPPPAATQFDYEHAGAAATAEPPPFDPLAAAPEPTHEATPPADDHHEHAEPWHAPAEIAAPFIDEPVANEPLWYEPAMPHAAMAEIQPPAPDAPETWHQPVPAEALHDVSAEPPEDDEPLLLTPAYSVHDEAPPPETGWAREAPTIDHMPMPDPEPEPAPEPMPAPMPAPAPEPALPALRRLALVAHEEAAPGNAMPGLRAGSRILLAGGPDVVRNAIAQALTAAGLELATTPAYIDALISLHGLTDNAGPRAAHEAALAAFTAAQSVAMHPPAVFIAVQDGGGDFGLSGHAPSRAWTAGFAAFTRTIAREWPECATKTIDISEVDPDRLAMRLTRELVFGGAEDMVGLTADNRRLVPREAELHAAIAAPLNIDDDAVIIVSGGARGITAACLASLCRGRRLRLCLLGRTAFDPASPAEDTAETPHALRERLLSEAAAAGRSLSPAELLTALGDIRAQREVRDTIGLLAQAGADIRYHAIDINDAAAVAGAVERTRNEFGRIDGVIHAAGIIADRRIADKTETQFARVFATKVEGLANLLAATAEDPLRLLVMFGSLAGRYGNLGQADYALANATLAAVARSEALRRGGTCLVKSIAWGPWDGGMLDSSLKSSFARHDVAVIEQASGAAAFLAELAQPAGDVVSTDIVLAPAVEETQAYSDAAQ